MVIQCGPSDDTREVVIKLPETPSTIGVFVSGGIDSAILLFLVYLENEKTGKKHQIVPLTVPRKEGAKHFAVPVVQHIQTIFGIPTKAPFSVGDTTVAEPHQVTTGIMQAFELGCDVLFLGVIQQLPEHLVGWQKVNVVHANVIQYPFAHIQKSHVISIVDQMRQDALFHITHSCDSEIGRCRTCNGCRERSWGFSALGLIDPGRV